MLKKILLGLLLIVVVFVLIVALMPAEFQVVRSTTIAAPPAAVFAHVNDFHAWDAWSPWGKLDPNMTVKYEGPDSGTGAIYNWSSSSMKIGEGTMKITESRPNELIQINLHMLKPMEGTNAVEFSFRPEGDQTVVTWSMTGHNNFVGRAVSLFISMDRMIGGMFEQGLGSLKSVVEADHKK